MNLCVAGYRVQFLSTPFWYAVAQFAAHKVIFQKLRHLKSDGKFEASCGKTTLEVALGTLIKWQRSFFYRALTTQCQK